MLHLFAYIVRYTTQVARYIRNPWIEWGSPFLCKPFSIAIYLAFWERHNSTCGLGSIVREMDVCKQVTLQVSWITYANINAINNGSGRNSARYSTTIASIRILGETRPLIQRVPRETKRFQFSPSFKKEKEKKIRKSIDDGISVVFCAKPIGIAELNQSFHVNYHRARCRELGSMMFSFPLSFLSSFLWLSIKLYLLVDFSGPEQTR